MGTARGKDVALCPTVPLSRSPIGPRTIQAETGRSSLLTGDPVQIQELETIPRDSLASGQRAGKGRGLTLLKITRDSSAFGNVLPGRRGLEAQGVYPNDKMTPLILG